VSRERWGGVARVVLAIPVVSGLVLMGLVALYLQARRCDDWCAATSTDWHENVDAWQWSGQLALAGGVWVAAIAAEMLWRRGSARAAGAAALAALTLLAAWLGIVFG
jgi:hypothetical protein